MRVVGRHIVPHSAYMKDRAAKEGEAFERVKTALQAAFAEPGGEALKRWIDACPNAMYAALCFQGGAAF